MMDMSTW